jgi:hypothetical protein
MKVEEFALAYPARPPRIEPFNEDELRKLNESDGVRGLGTAPAENALANIPRMKGDTGCHLWVFGEAAIPYVLERVQVSRPLQSGKIKHTNLTGGSDACCGGELWFETENAKRLYVNGCSGRYGPTTPQQLDDTVEVFRQLGYDVISFGWDQDAGRPHMVLRDDNG